MKRSLVTFVICVFIGLGFGYVVFEIIGGQKDTAASQNEQTSPKENEQPETKTPSSEPTEAPTASADTEILSTKGCLGCHAVNGLKLQGSATGPDLSQAYENVEDKHGKPLAEFLKEPTSAVMSSVIAGSPLKDEEITEIADLLKKASEKK
ncbi:cytochrome C [Neobacillus notoginsengisoli]|uniref:Cytochrome C n=1 Tax=Neobacillus notoginsengisoli TaxID=1578198 RepID=A0A417YVK7_9BACI|nr:cytochrome C [Neobacillus notoginsengisoli]RHW41427.1 cytochrome C [Neobacillus notoginsengisoli]